MAAVSANDLNNIHVNESSSVYNSYLVSDIQNFTNQPTVNSPGSFDDLQNQINNASEGSVLFLNRDYTGCENSHILLNKNLTIDGQGHTINCFNKKNCFAFYSDNGSIILKNLIICNSRNYCTDLGGAVYITSSAQYKIENCTFLNNYADTSGGAIYNNATATLSIVDSQFKGNCVFDNSGGAIYSKSIMNIENCVFETNSAVDGGGAIDCDSDIIVIHCLFENNFCESLDSEGGAIRAILNITVSNSTFKNNRAEKSGGALYSHYINIINSSSFENNNAINGNGGAIYIASYNGTLSKYSYISFGNAIKLSEINDAVFINNKALNNGGAIYSEDNLNINNSSFKSNFAQVQGGAVYSEYKLNANYCVFELNRVSSLFKDSCGGAIFADRANCNFSIFIDNYAEKDAGAIYTSGTSWIDNSIFKKNHAKEYGGAIHSAFATINSSNFENNTADYGGVIYSEYASIYNSNFENNTAIFGGAVDSQSVFASSSYFNKNFANYGGAVYTNKSDEHIYSGCEFEDTLFINNAGIHGGAFYVEKNSESKFFKCNFTNNTSFTNGGATYMQPNTDASFSQCIFTNNSALENGGAIYNQFENKTGDGNHSVFDDHVYLHVENCTFVSNYAKVSGGAIFWTGQLILKPFSYFDSNIADTGSGGAIYTELFGYDIENSIFVNNFAGNVGGAINVNRLTVDISNSNFITNHAEKLGGAIFIANVFIDSTFFQSTFIHNTVSENYFGRYDIAIYIEIAECPNPHLEHNVWDKIYQKSEFLNTHLYILHCDFFENVVFSIHQVLPVGVEVIWNNIIPEERLRVSNIFNNPIKMNIGYMDKAIVGKSINVTFYLYNSGEERLYDGDAFDMNNASFDIDPSIKVVNKEFGKNSITLELIPQKPGNYSINVSFYGCCLSKPLDVFGIDILPK